jgi:hypothetical protein
MNSTSILEQFQQIIQGLQTRTIELLPSLILGLVAILFGWLLAFIARNFVTKFILYLDRQINAKIQDRFLSVDLASTARVIATTVFWIILFSALAAASHLLGLSIITTWFNALLAYLPNILAAIVIIFTGIILGRLVGDLMSSNIIKEGIPRGDHIRKLLQFIIVFMASVMAINQVGIDIQFLTNLVIIVIAALLFGAALAFGIGASTSVSNILGSFYLQKSYKEGNRVRIADIEGIIVKISPTEVHIKTKSGRVIVPAKTFNEAHSELLNETQ